DMTSAIRNSVTGYISTMPFLGGNPPGTPGPDDNYLDAFPQTGSSWSDLQIVSSAADGGVVLYAALGTTNNSPANGVYWIASPAAASVAAPPIWRLGDNNTVFGDTRDVNQFPTAAPLFGSGVPYNPAMVNPPNGPGDVGNIQIAVIPGAGTRFGLSNVNGNDVVYAATTYSGDKNNPKANQFDFLTVSQDSSQDWNLLSTPPQPPATYQDASGNHNSAMAASATTLYVGGTDAGNDTYVQALDIATGVWTNISVDASGNGPHTNIHTFTLSGTTLLVGTAGGLWSYDTVGGLWTDINGNL